MIKINKTKARNLYNAGATIYLLPCKVALGGMWVQPVEIKNDSEESFDRYLNAFEYYNCNNELGKYASFYIEEDSLNLLKPKKATKNQIIKDHILDFFDSLEYEGISNSDNLGKLKKQVDYIRCPYYPSNYKIGIHLAEGGTFLIATEDINKFIKSLNVNKKEYSDQKTFEYYCHLIGIGVQNLLK